MLFIIAFFANGLVTLGKGIWNKKKFKLLIENGEIQQDEA